MAQSMSQDFAPSVLRSLIHRATDGMRRNGKSVMKISSDSFRNCKYKLWINWKGLQDMLQTHEPHLLPLQPCTSRTSRVCFVKSNWTVVQQPGQWIIASTKYRVPGMHSIGFPLSAIEPEWKSTLKYRGITSLYKPKAVYAASEWNALQQVETSKYIDVVFTSDGRWSEEVHGWIAKANAVLHELIALWSQNGSFEKPQICLFLNRFCSVPHLWSWILGNDRNNIISAASGTDGFLRRVHDVALRDKVRSCEKRWAPNVEPFSTELRDPCYVGSAMCSECPTKDWRGKSSWQRPRESGSEIIQGLGGVTPTFLGLVLVWSQNVRRSCSYMHLIHLDDFLIILCLILNPATGRSHEIF